MTEAIEGQLVSREEFARSFRPREALAARARVVGSDARTVARVTRTAVTHDATKAVARNLAYIPGGAWVAWKHWREGHTNARYDRAMRAAEACSNWDQLDRWEEKAHRAREQRHKRVMDWIRAPKELVKALAVLTFLMVGALLALGGAAAWMTDGAISVVGPIKAVMYAIAWLVWACVVGGPLLLVGAVALAAATLWWVGRQADATPMWLAPADSARADLSRVTAPRVILALSKLGIPELSKYIKDASDGAGMMLSQIARVGCGDQVDMELPPGVSTKTLMEKRQMFAENLSRHRHEVFLEIAPKVRPEVRAWIANPGALDEPVGPSPLVFDPTIKANYKTGRAPWGRDVRGDPVSISLYQCHLLLTGASNQGKTRSMIALALWLAQDPTVEFWIADLKGIDRETKKSDWEPFRDIADRFIAGPADEHVIAATEMVEDAVVEQQRRIMQGGAWNPLVVIVDEAQKAFQCPAKGPDGRPYGGRKDTSRYFMGVRNIHDQGRVVDVLMWQGTQNPTNENLPKLIREGAHIRGSLAVGSEEVARMAVGDEAYFGGAAPHQLRKGIDRGTVVVTGDGVDLAPGQSSVTVRTHYVDNKDAHEIAQRAKERRADRPRPDAQQPRDLLEDVLEVLGDDDVARATSVADRLRERIMHPDYRGLNGKALAARLIALGVEVKQKDGIPVIRWDRVRGAIDRRESAA